MELRTYWSIIWRRLWLILLVVGVVALYVGYQTYHLRKIPGALTLYQSSVTVLIGIPAAKAAINGSDGNVLASEAFADTLVSGSPILTSHEFDTAISQQISADMPQIQQRFGSNPDLGDWQNAGAIGGALGSSRVHSLLTISVTWLTPAGAWAIANATGEVLASSIGTYLNTNPTLPTVNAHVVSNATDPATIPGPEASKQTLYILMLIVALIVGIALAFLADYLDDRIRSTDEATHLLSLPVYGEVPRTPSFSSLPKEARYEKMN